jgi:hypothetical protein
MLATANGAPDRAIVPTCCHAELTFTFISRKALLPRTNRDAMIAMPTAWPMFDAIDDPAVPMSKYFINTISKYRLHTLSVIMASETSFGAPSIVVYVPKKNEPI